MSKIKKKKKPIPVIYGKPKPKFLGIADVWHEGSQSYYRAILIKKITPEEAHFVGL